LGIRVGLGIRSRCIVLLLAINDRERKRVIGLALGPQLELLLSGFRLRDVPTQALVAGIRVRERLRAGDHALDLMFTATAAANSSAVITRNVDDFAGIDRVVPVIDGSGS
jgi:predicted nucleic acid-binding protein